MEKNTSNKTPKKSPEDQVIDSKLENSETSKKDDPKSHEEILRGQIGEGLKIHNRSNRSIFLSSFAAGLEIGFSFLLLCVVYSFFSGKLAEESIFKLMSFAYPVGFVMIILGKSILYTEQTSLLALPVLNKDRSVLSLLKLWGLVILGNVIGGYIIAAILIWLGPNLSIFETKAAANIGQHVVDHQPYVILVSAILAGWLMALLSWLLTSSKDTVSRLLLIYLITGVMSFAGLHHSIVGNVEAFAGYLTTPEISIFDYLIFIVAALLGNAIGGVIFVALLKYRAFVHDAQV